MRHDERGMALGIVLMTSIVFAIAAYGVLTMAVSRAQQEDFFGDRRIRAHMAAEAGLVWAMQKLWADSNECAAFAGPNDFIIDTYDDADPLNDTTVDIIRIGCPAPGPTSKLQAQVVY